jgi:hypothetical protein
MRLEKFSALAAGVFLLTEFASDGTSIGGDIEDAVKVFQHAQLTRRSLIQTMEAEFVVRTELHKDAERLAISRLEATRAERAMTDLPMSEAEYLKFKHGYLHMVRSEEEQHSFFYDRGQWKRLIYRETNGQQGLSWIEQFDGRILRTYSPHLQRGTIKSRVEFKNLLTNLREVDPLEFPQVTWPRGTFAEELNEYKQFLQLKEKQVGGTSYFVFEARTPMNGDRCIYVTLTFDPQNSTVLQYEKGVLIFRETQEELRVPVLKFRADNVSRIIEDISWPMKMEWVLHDFDHSAHQAVPIQTITINYKRLQINKPISIELLQFEFPKGTEVYDELQGRGFIQGGLEGATDAIIKEFKGANP